MAIDVIFDNTRAVNQLRAVGGFPQGAPNYKIYELDRPIPVVDGMSTLATVLDAKYKQGGVTTWERPGQ